MKRLLLSFVVLLSFGAVAQVYLPHKRAAFRQQAASGAWAPTNSFAWYNADSITAANGANVTEWSDSSGNNRHLYARVAPTFTNSAFNGHSAIAFNGAAWMTNNFGSTNSQPVTMFFVTKPGDNASQYIVDGIKDATRFIAYQYGGTDNTKWALNASSARQSPTFGITNRLALYSCYFNGTSSYIRTNGVLWYTVSDTIGGWACNGLAVGARFSGDTGFLNGYICEIIYYLGTMADADRNWVESSLKTKYGL